MNKYCVIARNFQTYFVKRLSEEVGKELSWFNPWEGSELPPAAIYFFRSSAVYGGQRDLDSLKQIPHGALLVNPETALNTFRDKEKQYSLNLGLPFRLIPWMDLRGKDQNAAENFLQHQGEMIVKPIRGQQGWGVEKLNQESLRNWWERRSDDEYLIQKFIQGKEQRLFFIGDEFYLLSRRGEGPAANFAQGGSAELISVPDKLKSLGRECIQNSQAIYGAIDLILAEGEYHFLELNISPGIEQLEKVSGENILQKLLKHLNSMI